MELSIPKRALANTSGNKDPYYKMKYILWIDDQPSRASKLQYLTDIVIIFAHGWDQINYYLHQTPSPSEWDLIILDHDMPLMDGIEVIREFLLGTSIPVLLCSNNEYGRKEQLHLLKEYTVPTYECNINNEEFVDVVQGILFPLLGG